MPTEHPSRYWGTSNELSELRSTMDAQLATQLFTTLGQRLFLGKFDYAKSVFRAMYLPMVIICPTHGGINVTPIDHLMVLKTGCPKCEAE